MLNNTSLNQYIAGKVDYSPIIRAINNYNYGLNTEGQPIGSFIMSGPTGVGKTQSVMNLARLLHGSHRHILRVDCGEYTEGHNIAKLIGAPPGYLGHRETQPILSQQRINAVASEQSNISIILFDEIEKAAPELYKLLLGVMDRGIMRMGDNNIVSFSRCLLFFTSNLGAAKIVNAKNNIGFTREKINVSDTVESAIKKHFPPEFIGRLDGFIHFSPLTKKDMFDVIKINVDKFLFSTYSLKNSKIVLGNDVYEYIIKNSDYQNYGGRVAVKKLFSFLQEKIGNFFHINGINEPNPHFEYHFHITMRSVEEYNLNNTKVAAVGRNL